MECIQTNCGNEKPICESYPYRNNECVTPRCNEFNAQDDMNGDGHVVVKQDTTKHLHRHPCNTQKA